MDSGHETFDQAELNHFSKSSGPMERQGLTLSFSTLASGARQLVVQEAFEMTLYSDL